MIETFEEKIEKNQPLLMSIAKRIHKRLPRFISFEDVFSCGQLGLAQAARTYQPRPNAKFSTFAYYRISGAIYDGLSKMNWTSRAEYKRYKAARLANESLQAGAGNSIPDSPDEYASWLVESVDSLAMIYMFSGSDEENSIENQLVGNDDDPRAVAESKELSELVGKALATLPSEEEQLIRMTYFEGMSLAEAAKRLGKSRSWGSRTHARILKSLSAQLLSDCE